MKKNNEITEDDLKKAEKDVQDLTDKFIKNIDEEAKKKDGKLDLLYISGIVGEKDTTNTTTPKAPSADTIADRKEQVEDAIDPYERLNSEIETYKDNIDKLKDSEDKLYGQDKLDNLEAQIDEYGKLIETTDELIEENEKIEKYSSNFLKKVIKSIALNFSFVYNIFIIRGGI